MSAGRRGRTAAGGGQGRASSAGAAASDACCASWRLSPPAQQDRRRLVSQRGREGERTRSRRGCHIRLTPALAAKCVRCGRDDAMVDVGCVHAERWCRRRTERHCAGRCCQCADRAQQQCASQLGGDVSRAGRRCWDWALIDTTAAAAGDVPPAHTTAAQRSTPAAVLRSTEERTTPPSPPPSELGGRSFRASTEGIVSHVTRLVLRGALLASAHAVSITAVSCNDARQVAGRTRRQPGLHQRLACLTVAVEKAQKISIE